MDCLHLNWVTDIITVISSVVYYCFNRISNGLHQIKNFFDVFLPDFYHHEGFVPLQGFLHAFKHFQFKTFHVNLDEADLFLNAKFVNSYNLYIAFLLKRYLVIGCVLLCNDRWREKVINHSEIIWIDIHIPF